MQDEELYTTNVIFIAVSLFVFLLVGIFFVFPLFAAYFLSLSVVPVSFVYVVSLLARRLVASKTYDLGARHHDAFRSVLSSSISGS
jgi:hypothetical protein